MNKCLRTLWMGNIEPWMDSISLSNSLCELNILPQKIIVKNPPNKRGCAFLEFESRNVAENVIKNFNGKNINGLELKFNWVKSFEEKYSQPKITKFTVRYSI